MRFIESDALCSTNLIQDGLNVQAISDPIAASVLFLNDIPPEEGRFKSDQELLRALCLAALDHDRMDILAALSATSALQDNEHSGLHQRALELVEAIYGDLTELKKLWISCHELLTPGAVTLKELLDETDVIISRVDRDLPIEESMLRRPWLSEQHAHALAERDTFRAGLLAQAWKASPATGERIQACFDVNDDRAALSLIHDGEVPVHSNPSASGRRTLWRAHALQAFAQPRARLASHQTSSPSKQHNLIQQWLGSTGQRDSLHELLYNVASGEAGSKVPGRLAKLREFKKRKTIVDCREIRYQFQANRLNPTFLPQLAHVFQKLVLMALPPDTPDMPVTLDTLAKLIDMESLVVFLAPGLSATRRDELGQGLRRRGLTAALFDDVDLCRLLDADNQGGGHNFVALLEIALEQLDLEQVSPFSTQDGQYVQLETYIGREENARKVALGNDYSRIFSGRKLGKSAFLRFVASTYDGYALTFGNKLNVFFITIAGGDSELYVVNRIIEVISERFKLTETPEELQINQPVERFSSYMKRFVNERLKDNVLLVLDEADRFVEGQLAAYERERENSLSFRMMKELTAHLDDAQMPRIRTVLSGYRVTHTRGGVWANAGDVLVLKPLEEDEAVNFLRGMLGRIGVDLGSHAPFVARRCGFQPAVLIRFGKCLLRRLKGASRQGRRETITVEQIDALATLNDPEVLDEIRTVVNNNFQGNRVAGAVFGGLLLALKELPPGMALTNGPAQVLAKLHEIDPALDWLDPSGSATEAQVERYLREFIDRELLMMTPISRLGEREYRLRIAHFLPVLTQATEVALEVREQIKAIRSGGTQAKAPESLLPDSMLEQVRYCFHENNADLVNLCKVMVIGSQ